MLKGKGDTSEGRSLFWNFPNNWGPTGPGIGSTCTIRQGDWKLIYYYETGDKELFNIKKDIGETTNLATTEKELVVQLSGELSAYMRNTGAQRPIFKSNGQPAPWPDETN